MPYKRRIPVPEEEMEYPLATEHQMDESRYEGHHTICQTLRDIYHMTEKEEIKLKCRLAMAMSKAMNEKLKWYRAKYEGEINGQTNIS